MHSAEKRASKLPKGVASHLDARLKNGWSFNRRKNALVSGQGDSISLRAKLPAGSKVVPLASYLAGADASLLNDDEQFLARQLQIVLPFKADVSKLAAALGKLDGFEAVTPGPLLELPS